MPAISVQLTSGTAPGPYTIYVNSLSNSPLEQNLSAAALRTGISYTLPDFPTVTKVIVVNSNPACNGNYIEFLPIPPSATPTQTPTNTQTATFGYIPPTPTLTPVLKPFPIEIRHVNPMSILAPRPMPSPM